MALVTVSTKRNRVYRRLFDHELAQRLHREGVSYNALAERFEVSATSIARVCNPDTRRRLQEGTYRHSRKKRTPCVACGKKLVWTYNGGGYRSGLCPSCSYDQRVAPWVRDGQLRCTQCLEWKPDDQFGPNGAERRRGRRAECHACEAAARNDYRRRHNAHEREVDRNRKRKGATVMATNYLVLERNGDGSWKEVGTCEATTPLQAVERIAPGKGSFVGVAEAHILDIEPVTVMRAVSRRAARRSSGD